VNQATVEQLADAADRTGQLVAGIKPDQWGEPTPCAEWDVQSLVAHLINGNTMFAAAIAGQAPTYKSLRAGFDESAATLLAAFRQPGALEKVVTVPFGRVPGVIALHLRLTELLVHGWDLARATGQPTDFPEHVVEQELAFTVGALAGMPPERRPFEPPKRVADSAPALDRLVARLGRDVG
jgi:uncharacterized protein (TIGR03086 family)